MWIVSLVASAVSGVFTALVAQSWIRGKRPQNLAWSIALLMFAGASFAVAIGQLGGWTPFWFGLYYYFGAMMNVPALAAGTLYLLAPRKVAHAFALLVLVAGIFAAGALFSEKMNLGVLAGERLPPGGDVFETGSFVRVLSRYFSYAGFLIVLVGALWSAWRLTRQPGEFARRLARGNILIAVGTTIVAAASILVRFAKGALFPVGLLLGVTIMFYGFLTTRAPAVDATEQSPSPATESP